MSRRMVWGVTANCSASASIGAKPWRRTSSTIARRRCSLEANAAPFDHPGPAPAMRRFLARRPDDGRRRLQIAPPRMSCSCATWPGATTPLALQPSVQAIRSIFGKRAPSIADVRIRKVKVPQGVRYPTDIRPISVRFVTDICPIPVRFLRHLSHWSRARPGRDQAPGSRRMFASLGASRHDHPRVLFRERPRRPTRLPLAEERACWV